MKIVGRILIVIGVVALLFAVVAGCTTQEDVELAKMRRADAEARLAAANAQGTVNVLVAQTDTHIEKLRAEANLTKELRQFDADMSRQEYSTALLEMQALIVALKETKSITEDTHIAAENSWWMLITFPALIGLTALGLGALILSLHLETEKKINKLKANNVKAEQSR